MQFESTAALGMNSQVRQPDSMGCRSKARIWKSSWFVKLPVIRQWLFHRFEGKQPEVIIDVTDSGNISIVGMMPVANYEIFVDNKLIGNVLSNEDGKIVIGCPNNLLQPSNGKKTLFCRRTPSSIVSWAMFQI